MRQELKRILSIALAISVIVSLAILLIMLASKDAKISKLNRQLEAKPKEVYIEVPKGLNNKQKELLKEFAQTTGNHQPEQKSFFEKVKKKFGEK